MKHIRVGKDISLRWAITTDGAAIPLEGRDITLELKSPIGKVIILPFRVDGNVLTMTYYGYEQTVVGEYSLTLWENKGKQGQNVVDAIRAFKLVRTSPEEEDFAGGDLQVESVDLGTANLEILSGGGASTPGESPDLSALEGKVASNTASISKINAELGNVKEVQEGQNNSIAQINNTLEEHADSIASNNTSCEENAAAIRNLKGDLSEGTATTSSVPLVMTNALGKTVTATLNQATNGRAGVMTVEQVNQLSDAKADAKEAIAALQNTPTVANSSTESDLDISDENGNVLARFLEGHIKTKNFDSSKINTATENNEDYSIIKVIFERGSIGDNGNFDKSNTFVFDGFFRTGKYISVGASPKIKTDTPCIIFGYDSSFRCVIKLDIPKNVDFVNLSLSSSVAYIKIKVKSSTYPNVYLRGAKKYVFNTAESGCQTALFEVQENVSGNITNENSKEQLISNDILYGGCIFSLPYNYSPNGTPSRLIIFCHETPDRVWGMQNYNNPASTTYNGTSYNLQKYTYDKIIDWLNKEGFAVFDVYGSSSKYNFDRGSMANADHVNCMVSGYNWFVNNYNIAKDGVCVTGKSIGGLMSMRITMGIGIPVICSGLMVPSLCAVKRLFVYEDSTVKAYCEDMNFDDVESNGTTLTWNTLKRGTNEQRKTYLLSNFDKWCLYDPWTCGINRQDKEAIVNNIVDASGNPSKWENDVFMSRHEYKVPLKIWSAVDDETQVSHYEHMSMVNSIRNMGGYAEIRTMPNGSGGHYSTDRSPLATRMNIVTKLGYECTDIPLAWVELINFFRSFIGINI